MTDEWVTCDQIVACLEPSQIEDVQAAIMADAAYGNLVACAGRAVLKRTDPWGNDEPVVIHRNWIIPSGAWVMPPASPIAIDPHFSLITGTLYCVAYKASRLGILDASDILSLPTIDGRMTRLSFNRADLEDSDALRAFIDPAMLALPVSEAATQPVQHDKRSTVTTFAGRVPQKALQTWFKDVRSPGYEGKAPPNWKQCWEAASAYFAPSRVTREELQKARREAAPAAWQRTGKNRAE